MVLFQNGRFSTGEPVYQIGTKNADGGYDVVVFALMSKAEAKLAEMQPPVKVSEAPKAAKKAGK